MRPFQDASLNSLMAKREKTFYERKDSESKVRSMMGALTPAAMHT